MRYLLILAIAFWLAVAGTGWAGEPARTGIVGIFDVSQLPELVVAAEGVLPYLEDYIKTGDEINRQYRLMIKQMGLPIDNESIPKDIYERDAAIKRLRDALQRIK